MVEWVGFAVVQLIVKAAAELVVCLAVNAAEYPVAVINEPDPQLPATLFDDGRLSQGTPVFNPQAKTGERAHEQLRVLLTVIRAVDIPDHRLISIVHADVSNGQPEKKYHSSGYLSFGTISGLLVGGVCLIR